MVAVAAARVLAQAQVQALRAVDQVVEQDAVQVAAVRVVQVAQAVAQVDQVAAVDQVAVVEAVRVVQVEVVALVAAEADQLHRDKTPPNPLNGSYPWSVTPPGP